MGYAYGTLKLYSHGPIDESDSTQSHHRKLRELFQANTQLLSGTAWSACYYLYLVALEALRSQEHSRDAHSQIFPPGYGQLGPLIPRSGKSIPASARGWNLFCRLGKSADGRNVLSRPWMSFQAFSARIRNSSRVEGQVDMLVSLTIAGSLKVNQHQNPHFGPTLEDAKGAAFQAIADELARETRCAVAEQGEVVSAGAALAVIRQRLLSYIPTSPIVAALDLAHLGITLQFGSTRKRLVQNILLNSDGSVKTNDEMPLSLPACESHSAIGLLSSGSSRSNYEIPVPSKAKHCEALQPKRITSAVEGRVGNEIWNV